jgi:transcriptional antiterminator NusG
MSEEKNEPTFETLEEDSKEAAPAEVKPEEAKPAPVVVPAEEAAPAEGEEAQEGGLQFVDDGLDHSGEKQWYVANTYSGRERAVKDALEKRRVSMGMEDYIFQVLVVETEETVVDKNTGKPVIKKNGEVKKKTINLYPGYLFVQAIMSDRAWYIIRNTPGVTGLVGSSGSGTKPFPIPEIDMLPILKSMKLFTPKVRGDYAAGDKVRITDGAFADCEGVVDSVDLNNAQASVTVTFFGRPTTVSVAFALLEKEE